MSRQARTANHTNRVPAVYIHKCLEEPALQPSVSPITIREPEQTSIVLKESNKNKIIRELPALKLQDVLIPSGHAYSSRADLSRCNTDNNGYQPHTERARSTLLSFRDSKTVERAIKAYRLL